MNKQLIVERDVMVSMRDDINLATDIYRPDDNEEHPVLVHRIPYNKSVAHYIGSQMVNPIVAAERGYVVVVQDCRGCFVSEGIMEPYTQEADDGYDCVEWAASQPWSNGNVGIYGSSYMGITCLQTAIAAPPHLKAVMAYLTGTNFYQGWMYSGGALELGFNMGYTQGKARQAIPRLNLTPERRAYLLEELRNSGADREALSRFLPLSEAPVLKESDVLPYWKEYLEHANYDDYWRKLDVVARVSDIKAPVFHIAGWYDQFLKGHLDLNLALQQHPDKSIRDTHRFIVGPWDHNSYEGHRLTRAGDRDFGLKALSGVMAVDRLLFDWFDYWLKGEKTPLMEQPRTRYFSMPVENEWVECESWPPASNSLTYYLHSEGSANSRFGDGKLTNLPPGPEPKDTFVYDPHDPVPTVGGRTFSLAAGGSGVQDQSDVEERNDVLVFTSDVLGESLHIAGNITAEMWITSSAPDTDFTAKLIDVSEDGYCAVVADGILRARFRNSYETPEFLVPEKPTLITIDLWDTAYTFEAGNLIRLEISSSSFPRFSRNANSTVQPEFAREEDFVSATQGVLHNEEHPSKLIFPVQEN